MQVLDTPLAGLKIVETPVFHDARGHFAETFRSRDYALALDGHACFVQDNRSFSHAHVLRGMHYQRSRPQSKLLAVCSGRIFDVAVDLRRDSPTFGQWHGEVLEATDAASNAAQVSRQMWVPAGFAHGFYVLSHTAIVTYKCTAYFDPGDEACLRWNDPQIGHRMALDRRRASRLKQGQPGADAGGTGPTGLAAMRPARRATGHTWPYPPAMEPNRSAGSREATCCPHPRR